jgi:hypothetical protein
MSSTAKNVVEFPIRDQPETTKCIVTVIEGDKTYVTAPTDDVFEILKLHPNGLAIPVVNSSVTLVRVDPARRRVKVFPGGIRAAAEEAPSGAYALVGARLAERGYAAIPIIPGTKRPGLDNWAAHSPTQAERDKWAKSGAGVGVVCGAPSNHLIGVDIDVDDPDIKAAIIGVIPRTTVIKMGQKGETRFYRGPAIVDSKSWNKGERPNQVRLCHLIGPGRQTLLPPTIHPDTKQPYRWIGPDALEDVDPVDLPELTPAHIEAISKALEPFGYRAEPEHAPLESGDTDSDKPHRRLNNQAFANLGAWVPALNLCRCRPTAQGYEAVAEWRASNTGRPIEARKLNLNITGKGAVDFGDGPRPYTAINLVREAKACNDGEAFAWLADKLGCRRSLSGLRCADDFAIGRPGP